MYKTERYLKNVYGKYIDFKVLDILKSSEVYKLVPKGHIKYMVDEFRSKFYDKDKYKTVPLEVLNGTYDMKKWFFMGYFTGNCTKFINNKHKLF